MNRKLAEIRPDMIGLVDGFGLTDSQLNSTIGDFDGNVYEKIYETAKKSPLNQAEVMVGWAGLDDHHAHTWPSWQPDIMAFAGVVVVAIARRGRRRTARPPRKSQNQNLPRRRPTSSERNGTTPPRKRGGRFKREKLDDELLLPPLVRERQMI